MPDLTDEQLHNLHVGPKKPCDECPWRRKHLSGWLGGYEPSDFVLSVETSARVSCHKTLNDGKKPALCAGALIFMRNSCKMPDDPCLQAVRMEFEPDHENVFSHPVQFLEHHGSNIEEYLIFSQRKRAEACAG